MFVSRRPVSTLAVWAFMWVVNGDVRVTVTLG
jgi:hypothetical protein